MGAEIKVILAERLAQMNITRYRLAQLSGVSYPNIDATTRTGYPGSTRRPFCGSASRWTASPGTSSGWWRRRTV